MTNKNRILSIVILVAVTVLSLMSGKIGVDLDFGEETLTVSVSGFEKEIPYAGITSLELAELPDTGTLLEGGDKRGLQYGTWENDTWGEYSLCITSKVSQALVLTMEDGSVFVLNYQDQDNTQALFEMFTDLLHSKGYLSES